MNRRRLGHTDLAITPIGLGTWAIGGGDWCLGWGPQRDADSIATIRRAIARGINWIDTAGVYGLGRSETIIARALRGVPRADRPYVFTSSGFVWDQLGNVARDLTAASIRRQAEASLRRLERDVIDLLQLDPISGSGCPVGTNGGSPEEAWEAMAALKREGKVRFIGAINCSAHQIARLVEIAPAASIQAPYSMVTRDAEDALLPFCDTRGIGALASSPLESGLLTGAVTAERMRFLPHNDWRRCSPSFQSSKLARAAALVDWVRAVGDRHGVAPAAVAVAWTLRHPAVTAAVVGARRPEQVDDAIPAATLRLDDEMPETGATTSSDAQALVALRRR